MSRKGSLMKTIKDRQFKVVRVTKTEFELDNGDIYPIPFDLGFEPTIEEFQKFLDNSKEIVLKMVGENG